MDQFGPPYCAADEIPGVVEGFESLVQWRQGDNLYPNPVRNVVKEDLVVKEAAGMFQCFIAFAN